MIGGGGFGALLAKCLTSFALLLVISFFGVPVVWVVGQAFSSGPVGAVPWPDDPTLVHFRQLFDQEAIRIALRNSLVVSATSMVLATGLASLAGFGLSRSRFRRKSELVYGVLLLYAMPMTVTMVAIFELSIRLGLTNSLSGLVLAEVALALPFLTWLMKGFYDSVPRDLDEATLIDGRSPLRAWWDVLTPAALPGVAVTAGLAFVISWSDVFLPIVLISDPSLTTLARYFFQSAESTSAFQSIAALGVLYLTPVLLVLLLLRRLMLRQVVGREGKPL